MWSEHEIRIENLVRAKRPAKRLAVDGRVFGNDKLHELLRGRIAQPTIRVDRRSLFQKVFRHELSIIMIFFWFF